jgi:hypothetical protein
VSKRFLEVTLPSAQRYRFQAVFCALAFLGCALATLPFVESGMNDDWSYIRTAQLLAQTGHVVYNGWGAPMIGWQLIPAVAFIKVFGFSFTAVRMSILMIGTATAFLVQRSFVRAGLLERNATLATLTFTISPIFLPLSLNFMTDVAGVFAIVVCLYGCLRALQAGSTEAKMAWISLATIANGIGGTARQISWLGVLVMVPTTLWLLRRERRVVVAGVISWAAGVGIMAGSLVWFSHQPNVLAETTVLGHVSVAAAGLQVLDEAARVALEMTFLLLPVLVVFVAAVWHSGRRAVTVAALAVLVLAGCGLVLCHRHALEAWLVPPFLRTSGNYVALDGVWEGAAAHGERPGVLSRPIMGVSPVFMIFWGRLLTTIVTLVTLVGVGATVLFRRRSEVEAPLRNEGLSWRELGVVVLPFVAGYLVLLGPRAATVRIFDRYVLPLVMMALLYLVRYYQTYVRAELPAVCVGLVALGMAVTTAETHDLFAMYRAALSAADEVRASGVPRTAIDGGWEYDDWTEVSVAGALPPIDQSLLLAPAATTDGTCPELMEQLTPHVSRQYSVSFDPMSCLGPTSYAPVSYRMWLPPRKVMIYVVKNPLSAPLSAGRK